VTTPWNLFLDPLLRGPTWGTLLVCAALAAVGVIASVRRRTQVGELISHAAYPGVVLGLLISANLLGAMVGAGLMALLALLALERLSRSSLYPDSALALLLALFFGGGILLASRVQFVQPNAVRQLTSYLFGQAPSMTDSHILLYAILAVGVLTALIVCFKELQLWSFDQTQARLSGLGGRWVELLFTGLLLVSVLASLKAVGVVLASAMLVAPAVAARQLTDQLNRMLVWAALIGALCGWLGLYASLWGLPSGPLVALMAVLVAMGTLLRGLLLRHWRRGRFQRQCMADNILKAIWRTHPENLQQLQGRVGGGLLTLRIATWRLRRQGWIGADLSLSDDGAQRATRIVRLHRLWEAYLVNSVGMDVEQVHPSAEEMEHILTPEVEATLVQLLRDPLHDPHNQPIPR
jgi:manganese/zinc/iron transport system permease protein